MDERLKARYERDLLQAVQESEKATMLLRQYAAAVLRPSGSGLLTGTVPTIVADVQTSSEGWLVISIPVMLPRRGEKDRARFLAEPLRAAITTYFEDKPALRFCSCVLVYEQIYDAAFSRRKVTDHDNLELKHCQDILEAAFLANDTAVLCSAFQCSHMGENPGTRIWILPPDQFSKWLETHPDCWQTAPEI